MTKKQVGARLVCLVCEEKSGKSTHAHEPLYLALQEIEDFSEEVVFQIKSLPGCLDKGSPVHGYLVEI